MLLRLLGRIVVGSPSFVGLPRIRSCLKYNRPLVHQLALAQVDRDVVVEAALIAIDRIIFRRAQPLDRARSALTQRT